METKDIPHIAVSVEFRGQAVRHAGGQFIAAIRFLCAGADAGQLVAECASRAVAEALVKFANGFYELRRQIAKSLNAREDAREHG